MEPEFLISAPDLIGPELGNTLWKKVRRRELTPAEATALLNAFDRIGVEIYPSTVLLSPALDLAVALDRTVHDSLYLALAVAQDGVLVTADQKFHAAVNGTALTKHIRWINDDL
ncbi:MAG TPA: type II toxin-antitoxin system VapC family toxin [Thermoanaerobaculia bacterium]|nr:type II toxin-antitoxin system VapC family toxin [Thermoanaerobaculia bacterium]